MPGERCVVNDITMYSYYMYIVIKNMKSLQCLVFCSISLSAKAIHFQLKKEPCHVLT